MFVISYYDIPDEIVYTLDDMYKKLEELGCVAAYEYKMEDKWVIKKKHYYIEQPTWIYAGDWNVSPQYYHYDDPNICKQCKETKFMQGNYCMSCNSCTECGEIEIQCCC